MALPNHFDINEWYILFWLFVTFSIVFLLPKKFPFSMTIMMMLFSTIIARFLDHLLAIQGWDLYDVMDGPKYELFDLLTYVLYAPFGYLFVYFFDRLRMRGLWIVAYIVAGSLAAIAFEWLSEHFNVFTYKRWNLSRSFPVYLIIQCLTLLFFRYIKTIREASAKKQFGPYRKRL